MKPHVLVPIWVTIGVLATCSSPVSAATYVVRPDGTGDFPTVQAAIDASVAGDVIELTDGIFMGPGNRDIDFLGKAITIRSQSGNAASCVIDCQGTPEEPHRGFVFQSGETTASVIEALTVRGGYGLLDEYGRPTGGGVYCVSGSRPSLVACVLTSNRAVRGGGASCRIGAAPTFTDCTFSGNQADDEGGGVSCSNSSPTFTGCLFSANASTYGGGLWCATGSPQITACIYADNTTDFQAAGAFFTNSSPTLAGCSFIHNLGIAVQGEHNSSLMLNGCTFYGNSTSGAGVVTVGDASYLLMENTIIAFSQRLYAVWCNPGGAAFLSCCDLYENEWGDWVGCIADQFGTNGNICADPLFCDPEGEDLRLRDDSPCAPFSPQNPECDLVGAWPVGCGMTVDGDDPVTRESNVALEILSPAAGVAQIRFCLGPALDGKRIDLVIHDAAGRFVRQLASVAASGEQHTSWNLADAAGIPVPAGVYFCSLRWQGVTVTRPLVVLR